MDSRKMTVMEKSRRWKGAAVFSYGFRPFFLLGSFYSALVIMLWVPWFFGLVDVPCLLPSVIWHAHELLFGFVPAAVAGFLLTAIPNWTGRLPVVGLPLILLVVLWVIGRIAVLFSGFMPLPVMGGICLLFPSFLAFVVGREIFHGKNWRNLKVWIVLVTFVIAQMLFYVEFSVTGNVVGSYRAAVTSVIILIMIIGGRVTPSFTINWIKRCNPGKLPVAFNMFDRGVVILSVAGLAGWVFMPFSDYRVGEIAVGLLLFIAGVANFARQLRWQPFRTVGEPIVLILHVAYCFVSVGFVLCAAGMFTGDYGIQMAGLHAWTSGAIGAMVLAIMTRASRGHTGNALEAPANTVFIYVMVVVAAIARILSALFPEYNSVSLSIAGVAWVLAFAGFCVFYGKMLLTRRR